MINSFGWKLLVGNSAIAEVNELKNVYITVFRFFECKFKIFHVYNLNQVPEPDQFLKDMSKWKHAKDFFSFGFKKKPPEKVPSK